MSNYPTIDRIQEAARIGARSFDALPARWSVTSNGWPPDWVRESGTGIFMSPTTGGKLAKELADRAREETRMRVASTKEIMKAVRVEVGTHRSRYAELLDELTKVDPGDASRVHGLTHQLAQASHSYATARGVLGFHEVTLAELQGSRA